ncbi:Ibr domain protein (macronuclear) [Tetrahymena thermophila SB210]|uniref:Ibr domain protein n=1 Tax=Tetrahymena thermophila (strain SB210) TaxID=312017 RepID=Q23TC9_TETTS|nr:Ibr domain protein [Tetrahymena thermophila SB210]EAR99777.2 Ibr domain protein [Tetrahymena thermophila SB210]|eukprot:XP_001020022.2 Ibr domain protein [Tetrahymena thermophila SB210]
MSNQLFLHNKLHSQKASGKVGNGEFNENTSFSEIIAESGENRFFSNPNNNNNINNNRLAGQTKDETNVESSHNLMQKPNQMQQDIKFPLYSFSNSQLPGFVQHNQQQQQSLQVIPGQQNQTFRIHYKSLLSESQESIQKEKGSLKDDRSINQNLNQLQPYIDKQNQLTRSQNLIKQLKLKPVQYELYKNLKEMKVKSEIAFFILVSENCMSMEETLSFFTTDEENQHLHFFLPRSNINDDICEICLSSKRMHAKNSLENINTALSIRQYIRELSQQDCLENADIKEMLSQSEKDVNMNLLNQQTLQLNTFQVQMSPRSPLRKRTMTCQICYNQVDESSMLYFNNQNHEICIECFRTYLSEEIMISKIENLKCPHCSCTLSEQTIIDHTTASLYKKYKIFLRNTLINKDPLKRFCPTPNCDQIISLKDKDQKNAKCDSCKIVICCQCNRIEHQGISCEDLLEKEIEDLTDSRDIQRCNKCKSLVQKVQGCNHMTCSICQYQWCWLCGNTYTKIHMMPLNPFGCPFLQSERFTVKNMQMWKIYLLRFFTLIAVIILLPFAIIFSGPILALYGYFEIMNRYMYINMHTNSLFKKFIILLGGFLAFILGFLLDPLILISIIPLGIYVLCIQIHEKNRIEAISNLRLRELQQRNESINNIQVNTHSNQPLYENDHQVVILL